MKKILFCCFLVPVLVLGQSSFEAGHSLGMVEGVLEASGLAASRTRMGWLWTHNDSDDGSRIFLLDPTGKLSTQYYLPQASNHDWEDMAAARIQDTAYLYIADIGDNYARFDLHFIYRLREPTGQPHKLSDYQLTSQTIRFRYPASLRPDAETLLVDAQTQDLYVVSKQADSARLFVLPYPQSFHDTLTAQHVLSLPLPGVTGGDMAPDNSGLLLRTYTGIFYWPRLPNQSWAMALRAKPIAVPHIRELQGEAICFAADGSGFYTLSENPLHAPLPLYFYKKK